MSAAGEAKDARASRAKPRLEERVCEHGWRPTLDVCIGATVSRRARRRARRRAIAHSADKVTLDNSMLARKAA
jgi:hypothetical protein